MEEIVTCKIHSNIVFKWSFCWSEINQCNCNNNEAVGVSIWSIFMLYFVCSLWHSCHYQSCWMLLCWSLQRGKVVKEKGREINRPCHQTNQHIAPCSMDKNLPLIEQVSNYLNILFCTIISYSICDHWQLQNVAFYLFFLKCRDYLVKHCKQIGYMCWPAQEFLRFLL